AIEEVVGTGSASTGKAGSGVPLVERIGGGALAQSDCVPLEGIGRVAGSRAIAGVASGERGGAADFAFVGGVPCRSIRLTKAWATRFMPSVASSGCES